MPEPEFIELTDFDCELAIGEGVNLSCSELSGDTAKPIMFEYIEPLLRALLRYSGQTSCNDLPDLLISLK